MIDLFLYFVIIAMFDKKYVLDQLFHLVWLQIHDKEERIEFGMKEFDDNISKDIKGIIEATREIEKYKDSIVNDFLKWKEKRN